MYTARERGKDSLSPLSGAVFDVSRLSDVEAMRWIDNLYGWGLEGVRASKPHPYFSLEIGQYDVQTVNFRASKKDLSIARPLGGSLLIARAASGIKVAPPMPLPPPVIRATLFKGGLLPLSTHIAHRSLFDTARPPLCGRLLFSEKRSRS